MLEPKPEKLKIFSIARQEKDRDFPGAANFRRRACLAFAQSQANHARPHLDQNADVRVGDGVLTGPNPA